MRPGGFAAKPLWTVAGGDEEQRGGVGANAVQSERAGCMRGDERDEQFVETVDLVGEELAARRPSSRSAIRVA